jgi:transcriptional regulator with XRE-family HTH domain
MLQEHYPNRLLYLRRRLRLSQKQMAMLIGLKDRTMISKYERGHVVPSFEVAAKFQTIFDINTADIFPRLFSEWRQEVEYARISIRRRLAATKEHR